jgi:colanic acid/amylovoran biosynthesis glycosyltransferase
MPENPIVLADAACRDPRFHATAPSFAQPTGAEPSHNHDVDDLQVNKATHAYFWGNFVPLRLGYLIPEFPGQTHVFFWREVLALREMGVEVSLISTRRTSPEACRHGFADEARRDTHYVYPPVAGRSAKTLAAHPASVFRAATYVLGLKETGAKGKVKLMAMLACAADLVSFARNTGLDHIHVHSCADAAHLVAICRILGGPTYSLTLHGDLPVYGVDHSRKMGLASLISTDGMHLKTQIVEQVGFPDERILSTCMGLDTLRFAPDGRRQYVSGRLHLVTVARLDACKGHVHALAGIRRAVDRGCNIRYSIAGKGEYRAALEAEVDRLSLRDRVEFMGTLGEEEVLQLLLSADAFMLSSVGLGEAYPISVMEAMSCGLPVVASIIGATADMIRDGENGLLVAQRDEVGLAEALMRLANDVDLRQRIGVAARARAQSAFDVRVTAARLLAEIERWRNLDNDRNGNKR